MIPAVVWMGGVWFQARWLEASDVFVCDNIQYPKRQAMPMCTSLLMQRSARSWLRSLFKNRWLQRTLRLSVLVTEASSAWRVVGADAVLQHQINISQRRGRWTPRAKAKVSSLTHLFVEPLRPFLFVTLFPFLLVLLIENSSSCTIEIPLR